MKRRTPLMAGLLAVTALAGTEASAAQAASTDPVHPGPALNFNRFLRRYEAANTAFVNGDPAPWLAITAERDPASIFGGFGGLGEAGVATVRQRYLLAASAFQPSGAVVDFEYLVRDVRGSLAYTVAIERAQVRYTGQSQPQPHILRVTMIFRHDRGAWKIVHRQGDSMVNLELPTPDQ